MNLNLSAQIKLQEAFQAQSLSINIQPNYIIVENSENQDEEKISKIVQSAGFYPFISKNKINRNFAFIITPYEIPEFFKKHIAAQIREVRHGNNKQTFSTMDSDEDNESTQSINEPQSNFAKALLDEFELNNGWFSKYFRYVVEDIERFLSKPIVIRTILLNLRLLSVKGYEGISYLNFLVKLQKEYPRAFLTAVFPIGITPSAEWIQNVKEYPFEAKECLLKIEKEVLPGSSTFLTFLMAHPGICPPHLIEQLLSSDKELPSHLGWAILFHQHELQEILLKYFPEDYFKNVQKYSKDYEWYLGLILAYESWEPLGKLLEKDLDLSNAFHFFKVAVEERSLPFVERMLDHGFRISDQRNYDEVIQQALESHHLGIIRILCEKGAKKGVESASYPEVLNFRSDQALSCLQSWLLFSPLEEVFALAKHPHFSSLNDLLPSLIKKLSFCVRFPRRKYRTTVNENWENTEEYVQSTWKYAEQNSQLADKLLPKLSKMTWRELLDKIALERVDRGQLDSNKRELYRTRRVNTEHTGIDATIILGNSNNLNTIPQATRYSPSICLLRNYLREKDISIFSKNVNSSLTINSSETDRNNINYGLTYTFNYCIPETQEAVPLTSVSFDPSLYGGPFKLAWRHSSIDAIKKLEKHHEKLFRKLIDDKLEEGERKEILVRCYWLASTLCEFNRGTPHNAMMLLNLLHMHLKLPPPIPKLSCFFLDNAMLMLPVEEAIIKWDTFLEKNDLIANQA